MNGKNLDRCVGGLLVVIVLQMIALLVIAVDRINLVCTLN